MADKQSPALEPSRQTPYDSQTHETRKSRHSVDVSPSANAPVSAAHGIRPSSGSNHHTAFMQCRACCNCTAQCSYYGQGSFDAQGNYLGS
jgi:hypothetical protein